MMKKKTTLIFLMSLLLLSLYDLHLFSLKEVTFSQLIWEWSKEMPIVPFLGGFVCGHLWWK